MKLSHILTPEQIKLNCEANNLHDLFEELVTLLQSGGFINDKQRICARLLEREKLGSTAMGEGAAIPHAKIKGLNRTVVLLAISNHGIPFNDDPANRIQLIVLILSPINSPVSHLQTLAAAASMIKNCPDFINEIDGMTETDIIEHLKKRELEYE